MKPEKKRKTDAAQNEQTKRHRAGSNASANPPPAENLSPKAPPAISFGVNPSPQAETLATDFHGLPFHSWVNPRTVVLFAQVDRFDAFTAAVFVFWLSFFANLRGCSVKFRSALFAQLISTTSDTTLQWFTENFKRCNEIWNKTHDAILKVFAENITEISDGWLKSAAGEHFRELIKSARTAKKPNPELTEDNVLTGFAADGQEYLGIPVDTYDSVRFLFEDIALLCTRKRTGEEGGEWFDEETDFPVDHPATWFNRWRTVLRAILVPVIKNSAFDLDRKRNYLSRKFVEGRVMAAPTPCLTDKEHPDAHFIAHLPIKDLLLADWLASMQEHPELCQKYGIVLTPTSQSEVTAPQGTAVEKPNEDIEELGPEKMNELRETGTTAQGELANMIDAEIRQGTDSVFKQTYSTEEMLSLIPVVIRHEPFATDFSTMMSEFNVWGQTAIMVHKLQQQANQCRAQAVGSMATATLIDQAIAKLKLERDNLIKAEKALQEVDQLVGRKCTEERGLMAEVNFLNKNKTVVAAANLAAAANTHKRSSSSPSVNVGPNHLTPTTAPPEFISPAPLGTQNIYEMSEEDADDGDSPRDTVEDEDEMEKIQQVLGI